MSLQDDCVLWQQCEDAALVSQIGVDGTNAGCTFPLGKFGNGAQANANGELFTFVNQSLNLNELIFDCWVKAEYNIVNGRPDDGASHDIFNMYLTGGGAQRLRLIIYNHAALGIFLFRSTEGNTNLKDVVTDVTAGTWFHITLVISRSASFDGANTLGLYINGVQSIAVNQALGDLGTAGVDAFMVNTGVGGTTQIDGIIDNVKFYAPNTLSMSDLLAAVIANKDNEGWPAAPPGPPAIIPATCARLAPRVMVAGHDLVALGYVEEIQPIKQYKTFRRDKLINNSYRLKVKNFDEFFSLDNPVSQFKDMTWQYLPIQVYNEDDDLDWDGIIEDVPRFHQGKSASILSVNAFKKYARETVEYVSSGWETAGDVAKGLMDNVGFANYNNKSIEDTIAQLTANSCYIKANFLKDSDTTLHQALERTAEAGCADCYSWRGIVHFKHWTPYTGGVKVYLDTADFKRAPAIRSLAKEIVNEYRIYYNGSEDPITDADTGNIGDVSRGKFGTKSLREMGGKSTDQIIFKDSASCQYIGECLIRRPHINLDKANVRAVQEVKFAISLDYREFIDLNTYLRASFVDEQWDERLLEIFIFTKNFNTRLIEITAYEAQE